VRAVLQSCSHLLSYETAQQANEHQKETVPLVPATDRTARIEHSGNAYVPPAVNLRAREEVLTSGNDSNNDNPRRHIHVKLWEAPSPRQILPDAHVSVLPLSMRGLLAPASALDPLRKVNRHRSQPVAWDASILWGHIFFREKCDFWARCANTRVDARSYCDAVCRSTVNEDIWKI